MGIAIKDTSTLAAKFVKRAQAATTDLQNGLQNPRRSQTAEAIAAVPRWTQAVSSPDASKRLATNLQKAGDGKWQANAIRKGVTEGRYSAGVGSAGPDWAAGTEPMLNALRNLTLPEKGLRRSPQNLQRVAAVNQAVATASGR